MIQTRYVKDENGNTIDYNTELYISIFELDCDIHMLAKKFRDTAAMLDRLPEAASTEREVPAVFSDEKEKLSIELPWDARPLRLFVRTGCEKAKIDGEWLNGRMITMKKDSGSTVTNIELLEEVNPELYEKIPVAEAIFFEKISNLLEEMKRMEEVKA